jgi:hypothetical protein
MWSRRPLPRQSNSWGGRTPSTAIGALCAGCYLAIFLVYTIGESEIIYIYLPYNLRCLETLRKSL